ncbi:carboxylate--amine ligase [Paenibacillus sp. Marseille-Q4541]|uniref:ATP-grasp domain-containing protein n=1 Tax=Paenibacillus sp. Marseille-Q4541 TaxID=2831522 RepID=UPI001BA7EA29|nr:carboxylate--amine ligase [Paenibacillus sp. Marseille-Q4541]
MSILILSKTAYAKSPFDVWLKELNEDLVVISSEKRKKDYTNYSQVEFFDHYETNPLIELSALKQGENSFFRAVIATSEFDILRAGRIRNYLDIEGQSYDSANAFRNKVIMKTILQEGGLSVPPFRKVTSVIDILEFSEIHGFPIVIKPIYGSGSSDVFVLENESDIFGFAQNEIKPNQEVEIFIEGDMYHIDGLIVDSEIRFIWPSKYINGCLSFQDKTFNGSYLLDESNPLFNRLITFVKEALILLPTPKDTSFHAEVFHTPSDELIFCEIASRTGGGLIRETIKGSFDLDLTQASVQAQCGLKNGLADEYPCLTAGGFILIPTQEGVLISLPEKYPEWVTLKVIEGSPGQRFTDSDSSVDTIASFRIQGDSQTQVEKRIVELALFFEKHTNWERRKEEYH